MSSESDRQRTEFDLTGLTDEEVRETFVFLAEIISELIILLVPRYAAIARIVLHLIHKITKEMERCQDGTTKREAPSRA